MSTRTERYQQGRALRHACPRSSHAQWEPRPERSDPVDLIEESNAGRIPGLIPLRYARMALSPFSFFRGSAIIQARDLAGGAASGIVVQLCGDCHLMNFGGFGTPERNLIFDINDFDETFPGPWEWDVKRLAVSTVLAARYRALSKSACEAVARATVASYRRRMAEYAQLPTLDVWYAQIDLVALGTYFRKNEPALDGLEDAAKVALRRTSESLIPKLTVIEDGRAKIADNPPLVYHFHHYYDQWEAALHDFFERYRHSMSDDRRRLFDRFAFADVAVKVVGVGSVGTRCTIALFLSDDTDPLFLQAKEARRSVLEAPTGESRFAHQGERVVSGQRLMQAASDIFLGWAEVPGSQDYYVRQLRDMKVSADIESFGQRTLGEYGALCGWALARGHAKSGDAPAIAGYLGANDRFDAAVTKYAVAYADQVERDFAAFTAAIKSGRLKSDTANLPDVEFLP